MALTLTYIANIIVAGWISITCLFYPRAAQYSIFTDAFHYSESFRLIGALWFGIFALSVVGLFLPKEMSLILVFQFIYKSTWLLLAALPAILNGNIYPKSMAGFFLVWVMFLPWVIPWKEVFNFT